VPPTTPPPSISTKSMRKYVGSSSRCLRICRSVCLPVIRKSRVALRKEKKWKDPNPNLRWWGWGDTRPKVYAHLCFFRLDSKLGSSALVCQNKPRHFGHSTATPRHQLQLLHQWPPASALAPAPSSISTAPLESTPCNSHAASSSANGHHIKSLGDPKSHGEKKITNQSNKLRCSRSHR